MKNARVLIVPSECYEIGPLTIIEAFACGLPVIASDLGSMAERVETGRNGLLFHAGDAADLAQKVRWAFENPKQLRVMRAAARRTFEETHTSGCNYKLLLEVYAQAIENNRRKRTAAA
jgi:glycosyltransferase involved in cell wall biosynthesis